MLPFCSAIFLFKQVLASCNFRILTLFKGQKFFQNLQDVIVYENESENKVTIQNGSCFVNGMFRGRPCEEEPSKAVFPF